MLFQINLADSDYLESRIVLGNQHIVFTLPDTPKVLISVPHDGMPTRDISNLLLLPPNLSDLNTWRVAQDVIGAHLMRGLASRVLVDYNQKRTMIRECYMDIYDAYHESIHELLKSMIGAHGEENVLLLDLHGFTPDVALPFDIIMGTANRKTVTSDIDYRLAEHLSQNGFNVFLPESEPVNGVRDRYNGGCTIRLHHEKLNVDCIQLEIAKELRMRQGQFRGKKLSACLSEFIVNLN